MKSASGRFAPYKAVLANRDSRLLYSGLLISTTGSWAYNAGLLAFIFERTHSLGWVGAAGFVRFLAGFLAGPYCGVIVDRFDRTGRLRLLVTSNLGAALCQVALAVDVIAHGSPVLALAFCAMTSAISQIEKPSVGSIVPGMVGEDNLVAANALESMIDNLTVVVGPAIGAVLLLVGSAAIVFGVNAASFAAAALTAAVIRARMLSKATAEAAVGGAGAAVVDAGAEAAAEAAIPELEDASASDEDSRRPSLFAQIKVGVVEMIAARAAFLLVMLSALATVVYGTDTVLFVGVSVHKLGTGQNGFGYLLAGLGIGGLLMAPAIDQLSARPRLAWVLFGGMVGYCLPTVLLVVIHSPELAVIVQVVRGAATLVVDVLAFTALQRAVPGDKLGRVLGAYGAFVTGAAMLGAVVAPLLTSVLGLDGALYAMAICPVLLAALTLPALTEIDTANVAQAAALAPVVALLEQLSIFQTASRTLLERLASEVTEREFGAGDEIITEGADADFLYVLATGAVEVTAVGEGGGEAQKIRTMSGPTYFGEIGILEHRPRTASVTAISDCRALLIDGKTLLDALNTANASNAMLERAATYMAITHPSLRTTEQV